MKTLIFVLSTMTIMGLSSCEKCYECEGVFNITTDCCGSKSDCEQYRGDCTLNGGKLK